MTNLAAALVAALLASTVQPAGPIIQRRPVPPAASASAPVDARAVVQRVRAIIAERYVLPERRAALDAVLAEGLSSGRYSGSDPTALAERINADLARVGHDRHLNFAYDPQRAAVLGARTPDGNDDQSGYERVVRRRNHGVAELKLLPGNIRYMDYRGFDWIGDESKAALETALRFLSGGDAIIIDLRQNGGGSPEAVQYLISHFMEADRPLVTFYMNGAPSPDRLATLRELTVPRMVGKPLYVLTSDRTASAAEEFTGHVGGYRLGELIGGNTAGAGFRNDLVAIEGGFVLSVSVGRAVLASTGRDWEAVGHAPTTATPVEAALDVAQAHALRRLAAAATGADKARLEASAVAMEARARPVATALPLDGYAGSYGERIILVENGRLALQRNGGPKLAMIAIGPNRFAIEADAATQVEFAVSGTRATGFELFRSDGTRVTAARSN